MKQSINLLAPNKQKANRILRASKQIGAFGVWLVISLVVTSIVLYTILLLQKTELTTASELLVSKKQELEKLEQELLQEDIGTLNKTLDNFERLRKQDESLAPIFMELGRIMPVELTVDSMAMDVVKGQIQLAGHADTRDAVLQFRKNVIDSEYFTNINFPLTNLEKPFDVNWTYTFSISKDKL